MKKKIFKDALGNIHFGINAPAGYLEANREEIRMALDNLGERKLWRCNVCNDLRISAEPLLECPTCFALNAYIQIELKEFNQLIEIL
jgi:rubrerythrin